MEKGCGCEGNSKDPKYWGGGDKSPGRPHRSLPGIRGKAQRERAQDPFPRQARCSGLRVRPSGITETEENHRRASQQPGFNN